MRVMRRLTSLCVVLIVVGCTKPPAHEWLADRRSEVDAVLAIAVDAQEISNLVGAQPERCVDVTAHSRLCQWRLGGRQAGWRPIAEALRTGDPVNLLCELPTDRSPRSRDSCVAFPRRSDRTRFQIAADQRTRSVRAKAEKERAARAKYRRLANERLAAAANATGLSHVVGAAPVRCDAIVGDRLHCVWRASAKTYGHGTLVESIGAAKRHRVRLDCELPADGSPRRADACRVRVGS